MKFQPVSRRQAIKTVAAATAGLALSHPVFPSAQSAHPLPAITKPIPSSGEQLPVIGLGTNLYDVKTEDEKKPLREVLDRMHSLGGKLIDTAQAYGQSEVVIGDLLKKLGKRDQYFIATKTPIQGDYSHPQALIDISFKSLGVDQIDLLQIHSLGGFLAVMPHLQESKKSGRIRYVGISTADDEQYEYLISAMKREPLDFIQVDYSLDNRNAAEEVLKLAQDRHQAVLANLPLGGVGKSNLFAKVAHRDLPEWAAEFDATSWAQFFLKYVVSHPAVTVAIPGTTKLKHLEDNLGAGRGKLPDDAMRTRMEKYWDSLT